MPETDKPALDSTDAPRIALPKDLGRTLQFLSDDDLETLLASVEAERGRPSSSRAGDLRGDTGAIDRPAERVGGRRPPLRHRWCGVQNCTAACDSL